MTVGTATLTLVDQLTRLQAAAQAIRDSHAWLARELQLTDDPTAYDVLSTRLAGLLEVAERSEGLVHECRALLGVHLSDHRSVGGDRPTAAQPDGARAPEVPGNPRTGATDFTAGPIC